LLKDKANFCLIFFYNKQVYTMTRSYCPSGCIHLTVCNAKVFEFEKANAGAKAEAKAKAEKENMDKLLNETYGGATATASGLRYITQVEGTGKSPLATDQVTVHYTGYLLNGTKFDSSIDRGEPTTFPLNQVIPGWTEAIQLMTKGSKAKLIIPSNLAYGANGGGPKIAPFSTLLFEVELLDFKAGAPQQMPTQQ
jgi:FKBP-type peptidyl-prolyl cis-trans isomerase